MYSVRIGEKHAYDDWGIILSSKVISPPTPQIKQVNIPLRDGALDLTETLSEEIRYNDRSISLAFTVVDPIKQWPAKISEIQNYVQGKRLKIVFDDDAAFYYIGRVAVNEFKSNKTIGTLVIECTVEPFKYDVLSSVVDWEWDIFDFDEGIINEAGELIVNGSRTINLICRKKRMLPIFTVSAAMTVTYDGEVFNLLPGEQKLYELFLIEGENELTFTGTGTVTIDYRGGSL